MTTGIRTIEANIYVYGDATDKQTFIDAVNVATANAGFTNDGRRYTKSVDYNLDESAQRLVICDIIENNFIAGLNVSLGFNCSDFNWA